MHLFRTISMLAAALMLSVGVTAQSRGTLRIQGRIVDEAGKPVSGAQVRAAKRGEAKPEVFSAKTNDKGEYLIANLASGEWVLEAAKEGVGMKEVTATVEAGDRPITVNITLAKPPADPNAELQAEHQRAIQLWQAGKPAEARQVYEALLTKYPTVHQLHVPLANILADEKNFTKAVEHMKIAVDKEPTNVEWKIVYAELLFEAGQREEAARVLQSVDLTQVKEPRAFTNMAIHHINAGKHAEAVDLLTKLIAQFPSDPTLLYYRGKAYIVATKLPEAKADLEKFVAAAPPGAPQLEDAKKLLDQLNKK